MANDLPLIACRVGLTVVRGMEKRPGGAAVPGRLPAKAWMALFAPRPFRLART